MKKRTRNIMAIDIGLRLPHSQGTMEYLKRNAIEIYLTLLKINGKDVVEFEDIMILESSGVGGNHYSCPLCKTKKLYSTAYGHAQKHFESHVLDIKKILRASRISSSLKFMEGFKGGYLDA